VSEAEVMMVMVRMMVGGASRRARACGRSHRDQPPVSHRDPSLRSERPYPQALDQITGIILFPHP
jgi:hypothetical protein